jgi:fructose-1,6-bisphosphatase/inositol monophosphatase family enzyme
VDDDALLAVLLEAAGAVRVALDDLDDWGPSGRRPGQYKLDLAADAAALPILHGSGLAVLSEESGHSGDGDLLCVLDPVDGSTNAHRGIGFWSTSLCVLDAEGPRVAAVVDHGGGGRRFTAVRGGGAWVDGRPVRPSGCTRLDQAVVGISGLPGRLPGWAQFRALGSASLELCAVAEGSLDAYYIPHGAGLYGWDYLGGLLLCWEAGAVVEENTGADLVRRDDQRRRPLAAATDELVKALRATL